MPHYSSDSDLVQRLFTERLRNELAEQDERRRNELDSKVRTLRDRLGEKDPSVHGDLDRCYAALGDHSAALETLRAGAARFPAAGDIHYALLRRLQKCGLDDEALAAGERGCRLVPADYALKLEYYLYLPKLYDCESEIRTWHRRYEEGLDKCISQCDLTTPERALPAARGFARYCNFQLAYQGYDDLSLIGHYGNFVHSVMSSAYPRWATLSRTSDPGSRIRIGYVSSYFRDHTVGRHFLGWLTSRDRTRYRAHCYSIGAVQDSVTEQFRLASDHFTHCCSLTVACEAIHRDGPDVLVFTDVGMDPITSQIAALRLAPVQCAAWGHPVTTGLPTIDYFISTETAEPPRAQRNYTEKLLLLPGLGVCYSKPTIPRAFLKKRRSDFGLPEEAIMYLSCQSLFKYLPQYDDLFAKIAGAVPDAHFAFFAPNQLQAARFLKRLEHAFASHGLRATEVCHILPRQNVFDYWNLLLLSDVFLDSVAFSGGRTSFEAAAAGLPIVTLPGSQMRSRQSAAILRQLGIPELIARDETQYVATASRLGSDVPWRRSVAEKIKATCHVLFSERAPVRALESALVQSG